MLSQITICYKIIALPEKLYDYTLNQPIQLAITAGACLKTGLELFNPQTGAKLLWYPASLAFAGVWIAVQNKPVCQDNVGGGGPPDRFFAYMPLVAFATVAANTHPALIPLAYILGRCLTPSNPDSLEGKMGLNHYIRELFHKGWVKSAALALSIPLLLLEQVTFAKEWLNNDTDNYKDDIYFSITLPAQVLLLYGLGTCAAYKIQRPIQSFQDRTENRMITAPEPRRLPFELEIIKNPREIKKILREANDPKRHDLPPTWVSSAIIVTQIAAQLSKHLGITEIMIVVISVMFIMNIFAKCFCRERTSTRPQIRPIPSRPRTPEIVIAQGRSSPENLERRSRQDYSCTRVSYV